MLTKTAAISVLLSVTLLSACEGIILRPKWYPYFVKGIVPSESGQVQSQAETVGARLARTVGRKLPCDDNMYDEKCKQIILMVINRILGDNNDGR